MKSALALILLAVLPASASAMMTDLEVKYRLIETDTSTGAQTGYTIVVNVSRPIDDSPFVDYTYVKYQDGQKRPVVFQNKKIWVGDYEAQVQTAGDCPQMPEVLGYDAAKSKVRKEYSFKLSRRKTLTPKVCYQYKTQGDVAVESATSGEVPYGLVRQVATKGSVEQDLELVSFNSF